MLKYLARVAGHISQNGVLNTIRQVRLANELRFGELKGTDQFGNKYYESATSIPGRHRWVVSGNNRDFNASNVPAEWHSWLHYTTDAPVAGSEKIIYKLKHQPTVTSNLGSNANYLPPHHWNRGSKAEPKTTNYDSWNPSSPPPADEPSRLDQK